MNQHDEHNDLAKALSIGKEEAFESIYNLLYDRLYLFAKGLVSQPDAADVVAETFVKIWQRRERFKLLDEISAFAYIAIRNSCYNILKRQKLVQAKHELLAALTEEEQKAVYWAELESELITEVRDRIEKLSETERTVFKMAFFEGYKNEEIASILAMGYQTVSNLKTIALKKVKATFKPQLVVNIVYVLMLNSHFNATGLS